VIDDRDTPQFVQGDDGKAFVLTVKNNGVPVDVSAGDVRLFAYGMFSHDQPGTFNDPPDNTQWIGVLAEKPSPNNGNDGVVQVAGFGALCDIGDGRAAEVYTYQVQYVDADSKAIITTPTEKLVVWRPLPGMVIPAVVP
jgi:hypothetical protein